MHDRWETSYDCVTLDDAARAGARAGRRTGHRQPGLEIRLLQKRRLHHLCSPSAARRLATGCRLRLHADLHTCVVNGDCVCSSNYPGHVQRDGSASGTCSEACTFTFTQSVTPPCPLDGETSYDCVTLDDGSTYGGTSEPDGRVTGSLD